MYQIGLISVLITIGVECASYYPRSYGDSAGYSSTIANLNDNYPYGKGVGYSSGSPFPEATRYPNYSPSYGYSGYTTPGYTSYSSTGYPGYGYSTNSYNNLYAGRSSNLNYNQGSYGSSYGTGSGSNYGLGTGSSYGYGLGSGSSYGLGASGSNYGLGASGSSYGLGASGSSYGYGGSSSGYGLGSGSNYGLGSGSNYGSGYASGYPNYGTGSTLGGSSYGGYSSYEAPFMRNQGGCVNRGPQNGIYVDSLMGMWYGVEYVQHLGVDSHVDYTRTCIVIHIAEPMDRPSTENQPYHQQAINAKFHQQYRHLRLLWDEAGYTTEYALYFRNDSAGYWHVFDRQNGTLAARENYQHFSGTVQVLKAVNDHLLLNFCQEGNSMRSAQLYSVLFSRNPGELNRWEVDSVHSLLQNKKLSTASRRMVCGNSAERVVHSIIFSILTLAFAYLVGST